MMSHYWNIFGMVAALFGGTIVGNMATDSRSERLTVPQASVEETMADAIRVERLTPLITNADCQRFDDAGKRDHCLAIVRAVEERNRR